VRIFPNRVGIFIGKGIIKYAYYLIKTKIKQKSRINKPQEMIYNKLN